METNEAKELKEIDDFIKAFLKLETQKRNPTRDGMIHALSESLNVAWIDIKNVEASRKETVPTPWEQIPIISYLKSLLSTNKVSIIMLSKSMEKN